MIQVLSLISTAKQSRSKKMLRLKIYIILSISTSAFCDSSSRDTYLNAYKVSHGLNNHLVEKTDRDSSYFPEKNEHPYPIYNKPAEDYGPPKDHYGPPKDVYGPPHHSYGPPTPVFSPQSYVNYGPPTGFALSEPFYGMPHAMLGILDKIKLKLDLFTIAKIVLKLVIFKKIVSLIAILCLLLFIPSLKSHKDKDDDHHEEEHDDEMRLIRNTKADDHINQITAFVSESIDKFATKNYTNNKKCNSLYCKSNQIVYYFENKLPYERLIDMYVDDKQYK